MKIPIAAFADLSLLSVFMLWVATSESQQNMEPMMLPISQTAVAAAGNDLGPDVQILNVRWLTQETAPPTLRQQYEEIGLGSWPSYFLAQGGSLFDITWRNQILAPRVAPEHLDRGGLGCYDYFQVLERTMVNQWPDQEPVVIRASAVTPFKYIQRIFQTISHEQVADHPLYLAVAVAE